MRMDETSSEKTENLVNPAESMASIDTATESPLIISYEVKKELLNEPTDRESSDCSRVTTVTLVEVKGSSSSSESEQSAHNDEDTQMGDKQHQLITNIQHVAMDCCVENETSIQFTYNGSCARVMDYFEEKTFTELARYSWRGSSKRQRYLKGCIWSPDGTCVLTAVNGDGMHVVELPQDLYAAESISPDRPLDVLQSAVHIKEGGTVYDYCWYPFMNSNDPISCGWLASRQHEPIQMWDAYRGDLRCSYRGYNAVDEIESALSVAFSFDGSDVIGGYKKTLKIFKTDVPGRDYFSVAIKSPSSALAVNPDDNVIAVGSWTGSVTLYDTREANYDNIGQLHKHRGGITYMKFLAGRNILISGARKDNEVLMWDLRHTSEPIGKFSRLVNTNQRIYFDISVDQSWLVSGDTSGIIHAWNLRNFSSIEELIYPLHHDCCNGVSLHPTKPIIASSSGQHHFTKDNAIENDDVNDLDMAVNDIELKGNVDSGSRLRENSLIFWWSGKSQLS